MLQVTTEEHCIYYIPDMEVLDIDIPVGGGLSLTPQEKTFLSRCFWGEKGQMYKYCIILDFL